MAQRLQASGQARVRIGIVHGRGGPRDAGCKSRTRAGRPGASKREQLRQRRVEQRIIQALERRDAEEALVGAGELQGRWHPRQEHRQHRPCRARPAGPGGTWCRVQTATGESGGDPPEPAHGGWAFVHPKGDRAFCQIRPSRHPAAPPRRCPCGGRQSWQERLDGHGGRLAFRRAGGHGGALDGNGEFSLPRDSRLGRISS